jgi:hypothetical protein
MLLTRLTSSELLAQEFLDPSLKILNCHMKSIMVENSAQPTFLYK